MLFRAGLFGFLLALLVGPSVDGHAADPPPSPAAESGPLDRMVSLNRAAIVSFKAKDYPKAKEQLMEAVALGKDKGLATHAMMARTYLHLGIVHTDGLKDAKAAGPFFEMALRIRPDLEPSGELATKTVNQALGEARTKKAAPVVEKQEPPAAPPKDDGALAAAQEREKKLQTETAKLQTALAESQGRERKEREAREALERKFKESGDKEQKLTKQMADAQAQAKSDHESRDKKDKESRANLDKERAAVQQALERQLADAQGRERKERGAKESAQKAQKLAEDSERQRRALDQKTQDAHAVLAQGPDLPTDLREPLVCPHLDEIRAGADFFVHCAAAPRIKAKEFVFYYRTTGGLQYNALVLSRSKKGWLSALIPASRLEGKTVQHYVEARGATGEMLANNGKPTSPNIAMLLPASGPLPSVGVSQAHDAALVAARVGTKQTAPVQARGRAKRPKAKAK